MSDAEEKGVRLIDCRNAVQRLMQIGEADMLGKAIERRFSQPRQMAMALSREFTEASLAKIGRHFRRDHATVIHAIRRVAAAESTDPKFKALMDRLRSVLRSPKRSSASLDPRHKAAHGADGHRDKKNARGSDAASPRPGAFRHPISFRRPEGHS
jgi:hypothetical protein